MSRTSTVHVTQEDKARFGSFLCFALTMNHRDEEWLAAEWRRDAVSKHESRAASIRSYIGGESIPDKSNTERLATILGVPLGAMYLSAGYVDIVLGILCAALRCREQSVWDHEIRPDRAALERLMVLFPRDDMDAALDATASLYLIYEKMGRLNVGSESDFLYRLWPFRTWVMPEVIERKHLIHREHRNLTKEVMRDAGEPVDALPDIDVYRAIRADREFSMADPVTSDLIRLFADPEPDALPPLLQEAVDQLRDNRGHGRAWRDRTKIAAQLVNEWLDGEFGDQQRLRGRLRGCHERKITDVDEALTLSHIQLGEQERKPKSAPTQFE